MTPNPVTAHSEMSLDDAMAVFDRHSFRHLPVTHEGKLVGMLSDRDVRLATGWLTIEQRRQGKRSEVSPSFVGEVMRAPALSLPGNEITDLSPLAGLTNLEKLVLRFNPISDVTPLKGLTNLEMLDLSYNKISDLSPLKGLTNLKELDLEGNPISEDQKEMLKKALPNCSIVF
jgi:CBS domain-containing protein